MTVKTVARMRYYITMHNITVPNDMTVKTVARMRYYITMHNIKVSNDMTVKTVARMRYYITMHTSQCITSQSHDCKDGRQNEILHHNA